MKVSLSVCAMLAIAAAACTDYPTSTTNSPSPSIAAPATANEQSADFVARAFALAMNDAAVRVAVRDAMRASEVTEHKLVLQDFARTAAGEMLLTEAAARTGVLPADIQQKIAGLPPLDFYLPSQAQRRAWNGGPTTRVGYFLNHDASTARAYNLTGEFAALLDGKQATQATFVLQLAERKSRRISPQPRFPGMAIEDANDGTLSGSLIDHLPDGTARVTELADLVGLAPPSLSLSKGQVPGPRFIQIGGPRFFVPCDPDCGGGTGAPPDTTFLENVIVIDVCDNGNCLEGNEFEWHTYFSNNNGATWTDRHDLRVEGVASDVNETWHVPALFRKVHDPNNEMIQSDVVETDFSTPDDHFGSPQWHQSDDGYIKTEGELRCDPTHYAPNGTPYECAQPPYYYIWREVGQSMWWRTY
jgi:hypothetical protein